MLKAFDVTNKLYAVNAKKIDSATASPITSVTNGTGQNRFSLSVKDLIDNVNDKFDMFSLDVHKNINTHRMETENSQYLMYSDRPERPAKNGASFNDGVVDMVINENADFDKIISQMQKKYDEGKFAGKTLEDYLAHEMAHCMLYQDCTSEAQFRAKYNQVESLYEYLQGISKYADRNKSGNEALAEAFVRVRNKEEVPAIVKILVESYFGKWRK